LLTALLTCFFLRHFVMCDVSVQTLPRCIVCNAVLAIVKPSLRPSACPSVKTKESSADILIPYERSVHVHVVFCHKEWFVGDVPFYLKFWAKLTPPPLQKTDISNRYSLVAPQPLHLAKKVQLSLTGGPLRAFQ